MLVALIWATVPSIQGLYEHFVTARIGFHIHNFTFSEPLRFWVNDFLLTLFFFFVGMEIKREFLVGGLAGYKKAAFVLFAALGGVVVPAFVYSIFNAGTPERVGWGVPIATDTAFALGILMCFKNRVSKEIFTFLAALAIVDDIGAILVIAVFYSAQLNMLALTVALFLAAVLILFNYSGFRHPFPYIVIGILVWVAIERAGIHGSIAGILVAFIIPARPRQGPRQFLRRTLVLLRSFEKRKSEGSYVLEDWEQHNVLEEVQVMARQAMTPLQRWGSRLELPIALLILPLFALVNVGIPLSWHIIRSVFVSHLSLGIVFGLVIGKPLGVVLFSWLAVRFNLASTPRGVAFKEVVGAAMLTGVGFTMSLFISNLSFTNTDSLLLAKAAILLSSTLAVFMGITCITLINKRSAPVSEHKLAVAQPIPKR
jgi:NhaA family Na+:H+ antiporter